MASLKFVSVDGGKSWYEWDRTNLAIRELQVADGVFYEVELFNDDFKRIIYGKIAESPEAAGQTILLKQIDVQEVQA